MDETVELEYRLTSLAAPRDPAPHLLSSRRAAPEVICPTCRTPKRVTSVTAGLAYLSCGVHFVHVDEFERPTAADEERRAS